MSKWFSVGWWKYLFSPPYSYYQHLNWQMFICRAKGHPNGTVWYNPGGLEPDMRCKDCGEDLG
jgi:hypothetical protein